MAGFSREETASPTLARWLETLAAILDLSDGRLELIFHHGRLEAYVIDGGLRRPADLGAYDGLADQLLERVHGVAPRGAG